MIRSLFWLTFCIKKSPCKTYNIIVGNFGGIYSKLFIKLIKLKIKGYNINKINKTSK
jgi:hypothetical protein